MSRDIKSMYPEEVKELVLKKGSGLRAKQLYEWITPVRRQAMRR